MKTKQEIVQFLESKLGTKVPCVGNSSLDGQCVTLIKSVMEFIGTPSPYKARGHANTCISAYINEGIAKQGQGILTVYSNKDMAGGYGHIWLSIDGTFYESNGAKPLTVTKGKTYSYDSVCNFDAYITDNTYRGYDLSNAESMKICVDDHIRVVEGQLVDKSQYEAIKGQLTESQKQNESLSSELGSVRSQLETALQSAKTAKEALQKELSDQLDYGDKWEDEQEAHNITKTKLDAFLWDAEDTLKLPHTSTSMDERIFAVLEALGKLHQTITSYEDKVKGLEKENKKLNKYKIGIDKLSIKDCIIIIINKLKGLYGKK